MQIWNYSDTSPICGINLELLSDTSPICGVNLELFWPVDGVWLSGGTPLGEEEAAGLRGLGHEEAAGPSLGYFKAAGLRGLGHHFCHGVVSRRKIIFTV